MAHICPWWLTYTFDNPIRRLVHDPRKMLGRWVRDGMSAADLGCGLGHFTLGLAELVGPSGRVVAVDIQQEQLDAVVRRARRRGVDRAVQTVLARPTSLGIVGPFDFVLAFWMVHEVADRGRFFAEIHRELAPEGALLVAEPWFHVSRTRFEQELADARAAGFTLAAAPPHVRGSHAAVLTRQIS